MTTHQLSFICHQSFKAWCETNGDKTFKEWEHPEEDDKHASITLTLACFNHSQKTAPEMHELWCNQLSKMGWKVGDNIDFIKRETPYKVPFTELPIKLQIKYLLFVNLVKTFGPYTIESSNENKIEEIGQA